MLFLNLLHKILFILFILIIYRIGTYIPLPGIDYTILNSIVYSKNRNILGLFNALTGGAVERISLFTLNIVPYITSSIILQLATVVSNNFSDHIKSSVSSRQKIKKYSKYLAIGISMLQAYSIALKLETWSSNGVFIVVEPGYFFQLVTISTFMASTASIIWLAEQIDSKNIVNGSSIIIFAGIVSGLIPALCHLLDAVKDSIISFSSLALILTTLLFIIIVVIFVEKAHKKIKVRHPYSTMQSNIIDNNSTSYLPIKINISGIMPAIFSNTLLLLPSTLISTINNSSSLKIFIETYFIQGKILFMISYAALIVFFCFFYVNIAFSTEDTVNALRKSGAIVVGCRPGKQTFIFLRKTLLKLTSIGSAYIAFICVAPELVAIKLSISLYLGGTSILIITSVIIEAKDKVHSHLISRYYPVIYKKSNITTSIM